jgi:gas vesicle protein
MEENNNDVLVGALLLLAGGIVGAGAALLFAPQSGKRTRRDLARYVKKARQKAETAVDEFSSHVADVVETVGDRAEEILDKAPDMAHQTKKELLKVIEEGQQRLEKQRNRLAKIIG